MSYDPTRIERYLAGATFPATGGELAGVAAGNEAPEDLIRTLRAFEGQHFQDAPAVAKALTQSSN